MQLVRIALAVPLMRLFDYILPEDMSPVIGGRVIVPFGSQKKVGIVIEFPTETNIALTQLKPISTSLDQHSLFEPHLWQLLHWAASYYQAPLGEVLLQGLPSKLRQGESAAEKPKIHLKLTALGQQALQSDELKRAKKQREMLSLLATTPLEKDNTPYPSSKWAVLKEKGYIEYLEHTEPVQAWYENLGSIPIAKAENKLKLNQQQALAVSQILFQEEFACWLIDGVTGSGKTEIYLQVIEEVLKKGRQVLVLVPEIGLTPQTVQRFQSRFNVPIEVLHSNFNDSQRLQVWQRAKAGQSAVIIGTRSALFTQFKDLGLIVIDEEHDPSFKQQDSWRYHARDLAVMYAQKCRIPILLGSATPSFESLNNVQQGKYHHIVLSKRAGNATALHQSVIDLKHQRIQQGLSDALIAKMTTHLEKGNQVLLFLNRRGFAPVLFCHECGWISQCQHCEKPYTYHQHNRVLRCHHCASQKIVPMQCEQCGSTHLITTGLGTEQLEQVLKTRFPQYHITRIDRDSTARKGALEGRLEDIQQGKSQILIGTQMLAKGHHFPNVTLVALLNVDNALFSLDFRAEERLAQLYVQVAGRAGRAEKQGEVILQTHYPDHPLLRTLLTEGYGHFAEQALQLRQSMGLPPFTFQALFKAQSRHNEESERLLEQIAEEIRALLQQEKYQGLQILGPMPAPMNKKAGQYRWQLLLQHPSRIILQRILSLFQQHHRLKPGQVRWVLDVDPLDFS